MDLEGKQIHFKNKTTQKIPNNMFQNFNPFKSIKKKGQPKKKGNKNNGSWFLHPPNPVILLSSWARPPAWSCVGVPGTVPKRIHGTGIFTYVYHKNQTKCR